MSECEKMTKFIEENSDIAMKYILWEQEFYVEEDTFDLTSEDVTLI